MNLISTQPLFNDGIWTYKEDEKRKSIEIITYQKEQEFRDYNTLLTEESKTNWMLLKRLYKQLKKED